MYIYTHEYCKYQVVDTDHSTEYIMIKKSLFHNIYLAGICGASFAPLTEKQVINRSFYFHVRGSSLLFIYGCLDLSRLAHFVRPRT